MAKFDEFRSQYKTFIFDRYTTEVDEDGTLNVVYYYDIPGLTELKTKWKFPKYVKKDEAILDRLLFNLGMAEAISYWKVACPKTLIVKCGSLSENQCMWWKKLFYKGLGEFMYRNDIVVSFEDFMDIECADQKIGVLHDSASYAGCLVPIGGGKDSVVSLEVLKGENITTYSVNENETIANVIKVCDNKKASYGVRRILDAKILELNSQGYLNGHIPFSSVVAFSTLISAYITGIKYICLSNESSANESTVKDSFVNHQYSKSYEFESDFTEYVKEITDSDIHYFSLLRPLTEIQIASLFAKAKQYHSVFRSCNVGSKKGIWCGNCPKCLFVYIILSPFLTEEELVDIFGEVLLNKESLEKDFRELSGLDENKPFECVGTREEVVACLQDFITSGKKSMLTEKYKDELMKEKVSLEKLLTGLKEENNVPEAFLARIKESINA